ncbi:Glycosyltransferase involved in cell wall bisynthesis [Dyella jiangningensis]|uniref:glycosyltransferase family 2 protein n=1 Tax=Dyella sp. AtDHG13 TaxID=1938897 RepID=UPI00088278AB|nr:glycosyltransferase family 2 protein [Dyella sp. AtDHG13]PXV57025.1 glycosyltransferase involved in cell wall biosynthesis [Dyella sp. AtDHG13]SDK64533.1 Glycosyltransferase involved in cell wall bisynthesis [Dyella jiangningensis]
MQTFPLTLVVITYNEASCIGRCLDSVPFAAEKLVIDSGSTDDTVAIAQAHGARVVHQDWLGFGPQRNFATTQCSNDWILALDADEYLSPELADELMQRLPALMASDACAAYLRRATIFMGAPMRWYLPAMGEKMARLFHRDRARWADVRVHESLRFDGPSVTLKASFNHENNPSLPQKQIKVLRYAELKCRDWLEKGKPVRMWQTPFVYLLAFIKDYVLRLGFLDGWRGFVIAQTAASYAAYKRMRYYEMRRNPASVQYGADALLRHGIDR